MTAADESEQVSHIYAVTRSYLNDLVEASADSRETDSAFVSLAISLHGSNPDNLSQLLAAAILRIVAAERTPEPDEPGEPSADDPGAEQDRARDRWIDGQLGVV